MQSIIDVSNLRLPEANLVSTNGIYNAYPTYKSKLNHLLINIKKVFRLSHALHLTYKDSRLVVSGPGGI